MTRTILWTAILSLAVGSAAVAAPSPEAKCQAAKLQALRNRSFCFEGERRKEVLGMASDATRCTEKFAKATARADQAAARNGTSCRRLTNGDGTATDLHGGLQWELKTDDGSVHDQDDTYSWSTTPTGSPDGTAFVNFLGALNAGVSTDGSTTTGCFAGKCDWRLPTLGELRSILDAEHPNCSIEPCTTIPGLTVSGLYWSSISIIASRAWEVSFLDGRASFSGKIGSNFVRAVRGAS